MSGQEADELMTKRKFMLMATFGSGIREYTYSDIEKRPTIHVEIIPEREEFRISYMGQYSMNIIQTPWCSPVTNKEHFKKILKKLLEWAKIIYQHEEESRCMPQ